MGQSGSRQKNKEVQRPQGKVCRLWLEGEVQGGEGKAACHQVT